MALGGIDLNLLVILEALLEEGNVTRAGIRVGVPQPTMSTALARLRRHFNDELLVRAGNGSTLTPLARSLLPSVQESMRLIGEAFSLEKGHPPTAEGRTFSIGLSDYSVVVLADKLLRRLHELAPEVRLEMRRITPEMHDSNRWVLQHDLLIAPMDYYRPGGQPEVICRDRFACVVDPANPRLRDGRLSLADLAALPHAVTEFPHAEGDPVRAALERAGLVPDVAMTTSGWLMLPFLVGGTDMVAMVPERLACQVAASAGVTIAETPLEAIELVVAAWWHPMRATNPAHTWLRSVLSEISAPFALPEQRHGAEARPAESAR